MRKLILKILLCGIIVLEISGCKSTNKLQYNDIEENYQKYSKIIDNIKIELDIPNEWKYEEVIKDEYALKLYKDDEEKYAMLYVNNDEFLVCGTLRTSKNIVLNNGKEAIIGYYYDENLNWHDITFDNRHIVFLNYNLEDTDAKEVIEFIKTINIIDNNL